MIRAVKEAKIKGSNRIGFIALFLMVSTAFTPYPSLADKLLIKELKLLGRIIDVTTPKAPRELSAYDVHVRL
jgi:hypothetical protein